MRPTPIVALGILCLATAVSGQDVSPTKTIAATKRSTVFLRIVGQGGISGSGSGFVVDVDGDTVLIATNRHVAEPKVRIEAK